MTEAGQAAPDRTRGALAVELRQRRRGVVASLLFVALFGLFVHLWPGERRVRAFVSDHLGVQRVEALAPMLEAAAAEAGVDPHLVAAIVFMESRGQVDAVSSAGALGLMQLVPAAAGDAARRLGLEEPEREALLTDAELNLRLGAGHLAWLLEHRGDWNLEQVLVSYNAGRARLFQWIEKHGGYRRWRNHELDQEQLGEPSSGALHYALGVLEMRDHFRKRAIIRNDGGIVTH